MTTSSSRPSGQQEIPTAEFLALGDADHYVAHTGPDEILLDAVVRTLRANS